MDRTVLLKALVEILRQSIGKQLGDIDETMHLREDLNLDSLDFVSVAVEIQCAFDIELETEEFPDVVLVKDLLDLVQAKSIARQNHLAA